MKYLLFVLVVFCWSLYFPGVHAEVDEQTVSDSTYLPISEASVLVRKTPGFIMGYSASKKNTVWVAYHLTFEELQGKIKRTDDFRSDSKIKGGAGFLRDYRGSGFDRGHLAPAGDMKWSRSAMTDSFLLSNISPQRRKFNSGSWLDLENFVRHFVRKTKRSLYLVTGPIIEPSGLTIGDSKIPVASHFFKVIYDWKNQDMVAYLLPHSEAAQNYTRFTISVDSLESLSGLDFFSRLPDALERSLESRVGRLNYHLDRE